LLQVQNKIGHVFENAVQAVKLMVDALYADRLDCTALDRGKQHTPKAVANSVTEASLKGLDNETAKVGRLISLVLVDAAGEFKVTPADSHTVAPGVQRGAEINGWGGTFLG